MGPLRGPGSEGSKGAEGSKDCGGRLRRQFLENLYNRASPVGKPYNRAFGAMEMHPYPRLRRYFPRRGKSALR